jgi:hypothetical protein
MTSPILLHWVREGYRDWIEPETWLLKTARYGGETLGKLIRNKTLWGCFLADGSVENWAFETDLLRAQVKACEFLEVRAPGRYQWPIGEARYKNVQRRW